MSAATPAPRLPPEPFVVEPYFRRFPQCLPLLRDIAAEPWEDRLRFILADWLEDQGEAGRAELIRLECRILRSEDPREKAVLLTRTQQLFAAEGARWLEGVP